MGIAACTSRFASPRSRRWAFGARTQPEELGCPDGSDRRPDTRRGIHRRSVDPRMASSPTSGPRERPAHAERLHENPLLAIEKGNAPTAERKPAVEAADVRHVLAELRAEDRER